MLLMQQCSARLGHGFPAPHILVRELYIPASIGGHCATTLYVITHVTISAKKTAEEKRDMASVILFGQSGQAESGNSITVSTLC